MYIKAVIKLVNNIDINTIVTRLVGQALDIADGAKQREEERNSERTVECNGGDS